MSAHPELADLLRYGEGSGEPAQDAAVAEHLRDCAVCRERLQEIAGIEQAVGAAVPIAPADRAAMRAAAERLLAAGARTARAGGGRTGRTPWLMAALALAAVLAAAWLLRGGATPPAVTIQRYRPEGAVRADAEERFHLDLVAPAAGWLAVFARQRSGAVQRLMPHADPLLQDLGVGQPVAAGARLRVPANELLDFEIASADPPAELVVVLAPAALAEPVLAEMATELAAAAAGTVPRTWDRLTVLRAPFPPPGPR